MNAPTSITQLRRVLLVGAGGDAFTSAQRLFAQPALRSYVLRRVPDISSALTLSAALHFDLVVLACDGLVPGDAQPLLRGVAPVLVLQTEWAADGARGWLEQGADNVLGTRGLLEANLWQACESALARVRRSPGASGGEALAEAQRARMEAEGALRQEARSRHRLAALHAFSAMLGTARRPEDVTQVVVDHAILFEGAQGGSLHVVAGRCLRAMGYFGPAAPGVDDAEEVELGRALPHCEAVRTGELLALPDDVALRARFPGTDVGFPRGGAWLFYPLIRDRQAEGVLALRFPEGGLPSGGALEYLSLLARQTSDALARTVLYEQAERSAALDRDLLAIMSHDLRTPLSAIRFATEMLLRTHAESLPLQRIERSAKKMGELIQRILDAAAQRRGGVLVREAETTVLQCVTEQLDELRAAFPAARLQLKVLSPVTAGRLVDGARLGQALQNLVRNALQHGTPEGEVRLELDQTDSLDVITVENEGPAVPPERLASLFEPYARGERAQGAGLGLGLYIVQELSRSLGGSVSVKSEHGRTRFSICLPHAGVQRTQARV